MIKILLTGDLHLGRNYQKEETKVAEIYAAARMQALENAVRIANRENCDYFVIAGDLFDKVNGIAVSLQKQVCRVLDEFLGQAVLILPGNHDYYDAENDVLWKKFEEYSGASTRVFKETKAYQIGDVWFYPCICHDKHSKVNALGWLKNQQDRERDFYHIGIAHGAIEGLSYDRNQEYYYMTGQELQSLNMDAWLIGHTHTCYPAVTDESTQQRVYNAGTPQQTDIADHSVGEVFVLEIHKDKHILAKKEKTGVIRFVKKTVQLQPGQNLEEALDFPDLQGEETSLRVVVSGIAAAEDYENRNQVYEKLRNEFIKAEINDSGLRKEITAEMIRQETVDGSLMNQLLNLYIDDAELLSLAYDLAASCKK